ncbi:cytochrome P450 [Streptomyces acidiscabies]|uniref:Cytochrome P450 n=1 Tax=Streptomyces acidiscabies TaxID=42234 RepID=A0AAP6BI86_9ACTN|nr:cytochrome P450 [Streptomyces acidiscabies]MBP5942231.1 cytochrome P450 [Streptomyces sp. LBUM 1476]MBZ3913759.1 cytochrome P450 [Streptomyces acidiscabies]MDX2965234.1 cytochrome P450 [Streptomyces acidiscabies]MDX3022150.1 cytochrome P450 [Streptomyces acidiscabies]MDX3795413.1 cytochrome P450 [Streptomyces acidiscabies]
MSEEASRRATTAAASSGCPRHHAASGLPDGPRLTAAELHAMESERQLAAWAEYAHTYGPVFTLHSEGAPPRVYVSDPAEVRRLFIADRTDWGARGTLYFRPVIGPQALPYLTGEAHRAVRLLLAPPLHGDRVRALGPALDSIVTAVVQRLRGRSLPLIRLAHEITLRLIVRVAFGPLEAARQENCVHVLTEIMDLMYEPAARPDTGSADLLQSLARPVREFQTLVGEEAATARADPHSGRTDLLHHLATSTPAQSDEHIRGHIMTLLIAGHDTTASALAWALYQLELHPGIRRQVHAELDEPVSSVTPSPSPEQIARLPYLTAVCAEALRHGSVVPAGLARVVPENPGRAGHQYPAGTELVPAIHLIHHRPDLYPAPERFAPERFLDHRPSGTHYLPFGTGTRRCPGAALAEFELPIALARLLRTPGLRLTGADPGLRAVKNGPTMTTPTSLRITLDPAPPSEGDRP